jgi:hypothetical protein
MEWVLGTLCFVFCGAAGVAYAVWHHRRAAVMIDRWAKEQGLRVVSRDVRHHRPNRSEAEVPRKGTAQGQPSWWKTSHVDAVYQVTVEDAEGRKRTAFVRCGCYLWGLSCDQVTAKWDKQNGVV